MKVDIKKSGKDGMEFTLDGANVAFANAIRRIALSDVPVFAVDSAVFYENTSSFFDEFIADRLGLVPLKSEGKHKKDKEVLLSLEAHSEGYVYSKNLKSSDDRIKPAVDDIPIVKLLEGRKLRLEAKARLGTAKEHARFQPGIVSYGYDKEDGKFGFMVESFGQLKPDSIILKAAEIFEEKCKEFEEQLKNLE